MKFIKSLTVRMKLLQVWIIQGSEFEELIGLQALKPHRTGVTALCLTVEHKLLASAGEDRTVYLYKVFAILMKKCPLSI